MRVTRADGSTLELTKAAVSGDSLSGHSPAAKDSSSRTTIPLADVQSVAVNRVSGGKTMLLVGGLGLTAMLVAAAAQGDDQATPSTGSGTGLGGGSCPLVYSWDGAGWRLDSGTFGGAIAPALARTDVDNLIHAAPENGMLRLRVANELDETDYLDRLSLLVVDHSSGSTVAPDAGGNIHPLGRLISPASARDFRGGDALERVSRADGWSWESNPAGRDTASNGDIRDGLELVFPRSRNGTALLVIDGHNTPWAAYLMQQLVAAHGLETQAWFDSLTTIPELAAKYGALASEEGFLGVSVWMNGRWERQGYVWEAGPEISKRQVFSLDLSRVAGDSVRLRLESAPSFWLIDQVALDSSATAPFTVHEIYPDRVVDGSGVDLRDQLGSVDRDYFVMEHGDGAELQFRLPDPQPGQVRSYLVRSSGWYRLHGSNSAPANTQLLSAVIAQPHGASKLAVARMNDALLSLSRAP
ncbi:MAG: hypothetical protein ACJ8AM_05345 [Gemmatimonadales bacterium]